MDNIEIAYVAGLLARPDLLVAVQPDPRSIGNATARAMLNIAATHGAAYTKPMTMLAALDALPETIDGKVATDVLELVPLPEEVDLGALLTLKADVEQAARDRRFGARVSQAAARFQQTPNQLTVRELREAIEEYDRGALAQQDITAKGALERLRHAPPTIHYRLAYGDVSSPFLDEPFQGIGPDGRANYGASVLGQVVVVAAGYGVGKTRLVDNWKRSVLRQGASVATIQLEDDEGSSMSKLMGIHADLPFWMVGQHARGELGMLDADVVRRLDDALAWYDDLGDRQRIYDGSNTEVNIFDFDQALSLLEFDVRMYRTTHIVIDYVQAFGGGEETEKAAHYAQQLRSFAGRHRVNIIEISQVSNATMQWGSVPGQVAAKGSAAWGQAAHLGFEIEWDPAVGQEELRINRKKARNARRGHTYARINEETGKVRAYYDTPMLMAAPEAPAPKGRQTKGVRK